MDLKTLSPEALLTGIVSSPNVQKPNSPREGKRFSEGPLLSWSGLERIPDGQWKLALEALVGFLNLWWNNDRSQVTLFVMHGRTGSGKTTLAKAAFKIAASHNVESWYAGKWKSVPSASFHRWSELLSCSADVFEDCGRSDFAVLDDIGVEVDQFRSGAPTQKLCSILDARAHKFTLITTNVPPDQWASRWDSRVESRLNHKAVVLELSGEDMRKE